MKLLRMAFTAALRALRRNKLRSSLTTLGMVIGVAAVITTVGIGQGATRAIEDQIASIGTNLLVVMPGTRQRGGAHSGWGGASSLTLGDARAIEREASFVDSVTYMRSGAVQVIYGNSNWATTLLATTPVFQVVGNTDIAQGEFFTERDVQTGARVVLLGQTIVDQLFESGEDPIGAVVRIRETAFRVIGVLERKGGSNFSGDRDDNVIMPFTTAVRRVLGNRLPGMVQQIMVSSIPSVDSLSAAAEIEEIMRHRHRLKPSDDSDFTIRTQEEVSDMMGNVMGIMSSVLMGVASISLLVGGIGIMNILLVSVTERTREIGVRMAVGAKGRHILIQFLVESIILSMLGGMIGTGLGLAGTMAIARVAGFPFVFSLAAVLGAVLFSGAVGMFFGFYPARQASRLDPIASLRYE
ncbi:MAG: ABC transporter permease [Deltaproteobacteria bacterium]|nr:ABC transporter permease [Deltaproteobacteria bacterium]